MQGEANSGHPVNILNLTRSFGVDIVTKHLSGSITMEAERKQNGWASALSLDAFAAVGQFVYAYVGLFLTGMGSW